jgi:UDP-N-acetylglucosamine 1-carboxyvinyltransferase
VECVLENAPGIRDVEAMCRLLEGLGAEVSGIGTSTLRVRCRDVRGADPDPDLVARLRGSVLLLAPLVARSGRAALGEPGGDFPGRRSVATHQRALAAFGAVGRPRRARARGSRRPPRGLPLDLASVTATETALLAAVTAPA